ncbi:MAG: hypothetical protein LKJ69_04800 [Lactobacillus sp.]|jgi:energy-converting hydrogenase Eha subunit A|nr:hypothetical protein [Lactobacillus sp.]MCI2032702.1 hypothetical protein [Lactobacillus sp.]
MVIDLNAVEIAWLLSVIVVEISMNMYFTITIITRHPSMKLNFITLIANVALILASMLASLIVTLPLIERESDKAVFQANMYFCITILSIGIIDTLIPLIFNKLAINHSNIVRFQEGVGYDIENFSWRIALQGALLIGGSGFLIGVVSLNYRYQATNSELKSTLSSLVIVGGTLVVIGLLLPKLVQHIVKAYLRKQIE